MNHEHFQERLFTEIGRALVDTSSPIFNAFIESPRHRFVHRYRFWDEFDWSSFRPDDYHLDRVYRDEVLVLAGDGNFCYKSSNSQPSYILTLLEALGVEPGQSVLEIGSGSGWLAGIVGRIVGSKGKVIGLEILSDLAIQSRVDLDALGMDNVNIISGDGRAGSISDAPFDRAICSAGLYTIPDALFDQMRVGGRVLAPIRMLGHGDVIFLLQRTVSGFRSTQTFDGYFVPVSETPTRMDIIDISNDPRWEILSTKVFSKRPMCWEGADRTLDFVQTSAGFRVYMTITLPKARAFRIATADGDIGRDGIAFGIVDLDGQSAGLVTRDGIVGYGAPDALDCVLHCIHQWDGIGRPCGADYEIEITRQPELRQSDGLRSWTEKRRHQAFSWILHDQKTGQQAQGVNGL